MSTNGSSNDLSGGDATNGSGKMYPIELEAAAASLPAVEEIQTQNNPRKASPNRNRMWLLIGVAVFIALLVIIVPVAVVSKKNDSESNEPRKTTYDEVVQFLTQGQISALSDIDQPGRPQNTAARWIANTDGANLPLPDAVDSAEGIRYVVRYVMAVNYFAMDGPNWRFDHQFLSKHDICFWHDSRTVNGVFCELFSVDPRQMPRYVHLDEMFLKGEIPKENFKLSSLYHFSMQLNAIQGVLPSELCQMEEAKLIALNGNSLTGQLPACLADLPDLEALFLNGNEIGGNVPSEYCTFPKLQVLNLGFNEMEGQVPSCLHNIPTIQEILLHRNRLDGDIPTELCQADSLTVLSLGWNDLSGKFC